MIEAWPCRTLLEPDTLPSQQQDQVGSGAAASGTDLVPKQITETILVPRQVTNTVMVSRQVTRTVLEPRQVTNTVIENGQVLT